MKLIHACWKVIMMTAKYLQNNIWNNIEILNDNKIRNLRCDRPKES